jgi:1-deoxy-D-xylulose-5-phosphate reductoisomerase
LIAERSDLFYAKSLVAFSSAEKLASQAIELKAENVCLINEKNLPILKDLLAAYPQINIFAGDNGLKEVIAKGYDVVVSGISGAQALVPTMYALDYCKTLALANKESLVCAGEILLAKAHKLAVDVVPVDSEHSAIFQVFQKDNLIEKIILTASGGQFLRKTRAELENVTFEEAIAHPNWNMGPRISIDSSNLANKGLEFIEACVLFGMRPDNVEVLIHPESIIHSMVSYKDGSVLAHLGFPDMRTPISVAINYPKRMEFGYKPLDLAAMGKLHFEKPDLQRFPMLKAAMDSVNAGVYARIAFNAAKEEASEAFIEGKIKYVSIPDITMRALDKIKPTNTNLIEEIVALDAEVRLITKKLIG